MPEHASGSGAPRVIAVLAVRNERPYLANNLRHLIENGIDYCIIDNESSDGTRELLARPPFARHLVDLRTHPFDGTFDWTGLMRAREVAARNADADWILFVSADEIMHSYRPQESLVDAIGRVDRGGWDVINFNEFVFLPVELDYIVDCEGPQPLLHYYFFEPTSPRLMRARRKGLEVSHVEHGGHVLTGAEFRLCPETFALRHYIFRNLEHAKSKYRDRVFRELELSKGWHWDRARRHGDSFAMPGLDQLHRLQSPEDRALNRCAPRKTNYWLWAG